jgi:hypothetical protein
MEQKLTHWKKLTNPDYIGSYDFQPNEERIVTIKDVKREMITGADGKKEECTIVYFNECKPMILNATNSKSITKLFETPYIEQWVGNSFKLYVTKIKAFGEMVEALRIRSEKVVKVKPSLELNTPNFEACKKAYQADASALDKIKLKYNVSIEVENEIKAK